ncbi:Tetratricopeptide repeat-containing protein [Zobellia uliginosa]|uniref:Tetratricopeptide repeat-containing protein n=1 Tax=Zobellia uliginosa TaxID=143224 RepID=A0ABY1L0N0_9FLAO|nr:DUF5107 domain-containing protein [Zobellia uliginosa]SIT02445.1 Tetratricopeptide repeat-containing protein [Zobellia uliginosa]
MSVKVWSEKIMIPTYEIGTAEKNPIFLEKRVYQGSSGKVYPYPVVEKISDEKVEKEWLACFLENDFLKIMILPELGGRVQMAYDKVKKRHFVYYNEVIKPALVGLTGPWISGGIEFNWPQHHRPSTYLPVDYSIAENDDRSKTVWCSEMERMSGTKGMAGFTLHPDKAYLEIKVSLYNRTDRPQTFLWWANPAVAVNDDYQSVFPPDVTAVFDHGKRDVSEFPIAKGVYYKFDYSPGTDISRYANIPVPTSYMAMKSDYNFVGGYENDSKGGLLHVANHHISPGKKQWTWGNGDFGKAWDRNLTDANGPYIELMCGVYTDNQPDFTWLKPYEEKSFSQYFMPYQDLGVVKNASKDAMLNLEFEEGKALVKAYTTAVYSKATVRLKCKEEVLLEEKYDFRPGRSYASELSIDPNLSQPDFELSILLENGSVLLDWRPEKEADNTIPEPAQAAREPKDIETNEELFLNGLHLEQYRHATYDPLPYYREALERDPGDIRCNNAMGLWLMGKGKFGKAEPYFLKAYNRQIDRNPNPLDGEPLFNLGLSLSYQGKYAEAYDAFYKSVWDVSFMDPGYFQLSLLDCMKQDWVAALDTVDRSLLRNWHNHKARHLKVAVLRKQGETEQALLLIEESLSKDLFNFGLYFEKYLMGNQGAKEELIELMRNDIHNYIEISLDYARAGLFDEAVALIGLGVSHCEPHYPMALYFKAWFLTRSGKDSAALETIKVAEKALPDYCFPHRLEAVLALESAIDVYPECAKAPYYLGNFWYNALQYDDAISCWENSVKNDPSFPTVHRNLALAYYNKRGDFDKALESMEMAFKLDPNDARIFMERDQLYKRLNKSVAFRFENFEKYPHLVLLRDDLYIEKAYLLIIERKYRQAYEWIMERKFHPWEGGEGKVTKAYTSSLIGMAREAFVKKDFKAAMESLEKARTYPHNLGEGKLPGAHENEIDYWYGCALEGLGHIEKANLFWGKAASGVSEPMAVWFYNDQPPETIFYQGLALIKLKKQKEALKRFGKLISYGEAHLADEVKIDYFAVSLPDLMIWDENLDLRNKMHCQYLMALGYKGIEGGRKLAEELFEKVMAHTNVTLDMAAIMEIDYPIQTN